MSRKIAHNFLWIPLMVVLLHSFVPHHHYTDNLTINISVGHQCPDSFLSDFFEFDLGSHHLEEYNVSRAEPALNLAPIDFFIEDLTLHKQSLYQDSRFPEIITVPFQDQFQQQYKSLRAPPAYA